MLLDSNSESEEVEDSYDYLLSTLALTYHMACDPRYLIRGTRGAACRLAFEEATAKYLNYPETSFLVDIRVHREISSALVDCSDR